MISPDGRSWNHPRIPGYDSHHTSLVKALWSFWKLKLRKLIFQMFFIFHFSFGSLQLLQWYITQRFRQGFTDQDVGHKILVLRSLNKAVCCRCKALFQNNLWSFRYGIVTYWFFHLYNQVNYHFRFRVTTSGHFKWSSFTNYWLGNRFLRQEYHYFMHW